MRKISLELDALKTALGVQLMFWGFPFTSTKKPTLSKSQEETLESLRTTLQKAKKRYITEHDSLASNLGGNEVALSVEIALSDDQHSMLLMVFDALLEEFFDSDYDLLLHVPNREAFDSLYERLKSLGLDDVVPSRNPLAKQTIARCESVILHGPVEIEGQFFRVIKYSYIGRKGHGMSAEMWEHGAWLASSYGPGCQLILQTASVSAEELAVKGVDNSPLPLGYDPLG